MPSVNSVIFSKNLQMLCWSVGVVLCSYSTYFANFAKVDLYQFGVGHRWNFKAI